MARAFNPRALREQVAVQVKGESDVGAGGVTEAYTDVPGWESLWADIDPLSGTEQLRGMQLTASATHRVRMWYLAGVKSTTHRLRRLRDGAIFDIIAPPSPDDTFRWMELVVHQSEVAA